MKLTALLIGIVAALAVASAASAKELTSAQACGIDDECAPLQDLRSAMMILESGGSMSPPPPSAPYYRLDFTIDTGGPEHHGFSGVYVPSKGLIATGANPNGTINWFPVYGQAMNVIQQAVRDLRPFPAPAAWPNWIGDPVSAPANNPTPKPAPVADEGTNWTPWLVAAGIVLLALTAGGLLARRLRVGRPTTA
jgi:hypothetical protein